MSPDAGRGLLGQGKAADFPWIGRISDIDHAINFSRQSRRACGGVDQISTVIKIPVGAGAAGFKMTKLPGLGWFADVEDEKTLGKRLILSAAPAGRDALQPGDHLAVGHLNLNRPGVLRPGHISA